MSGALPVDGGARGYRIAKTRTQPGQVWATLPGRSRSNGFRIVRVTRVDAAPEGGGYAHLAPASGEPSRKAKRSRAKLRQSDGALAGFGILEDPLQYRAASVPIGGGSPVFATDWGTFEQAQRAKIGLEIGDSAWLEIATEDDERRPLFFIVQVKDPEP